jgi:hypothetical protein
MSKAAELAALIGSQTALSNRNLIINGAMQVAQRATSVSSFTGGTAYRTVDRFKHTANSSGTFTLSQSSTAPEGFANSLKIDCTTADASPDYFLIETYLEGQDLQQLKKGTSNAESVTLSFHVRSSKTGTYQVNLRDSDNTRQIGATYTISSADTWEKKEITFAGDTTGAFNNDNASSLEIEWWIAAGSTYNTGAVPTSWEAQSQGDRAAGLTVNIGASTSDDFYITGIQLEVGEQATPFEHRSFADELARCQRYFFKLTDLADGAGTFGHLYNNESAKRTIEIQYPTTMRTSPTLTVTCPNTVDTSYIQPDGSTSVISGVNAAYATYFTAFQASAEL